MTENNRLKKIRKKLKLTQGEFANALGLKQAGYSAIERGRNAITAQVKLLLSQSYNVNINWLETGNGEAFLEKKKDPTQRINGDPITELASCPVGEAWHNKTEFCKSCGEKERVIDSLRENIQFLKEHVQSRDDFIQHLKKSSEQLTVDNQQLQADVRQLHDSMDLLLSEVKELREDNIKLRENNRSLLEEHRQQQQTIERLKTELATIKGGQKREVVT